MKIKVIASVGCAIAALFLLGACQHSDPTPAQRITSASVDVGLAGPDSTFKDASGADAISAECTSKEIDADGVGSYNCPVTFADGTTQQLVIDAAADGTLTRG